MAKAVCFNRVMPFLLHPVLSANARESPPDRPLAAPTPCNEILSESPENWSKVLSKAQKLGFCRQHFGRIVLYHGTIMVSSGKSEMFCSRCWPLMTAR